MAYEKNLINMTILSVFVCLLSCFVLTRYTSYLVIKPLKKMTELMGKIENEDFSVRFNVQKKDEIATLAKQFNLMSDKLQFLHEQVYAQQLHLKEAEIKVLQAEINPHFLFNTLNTIHWMVELKRTAEAGTMIRDLSNLFKISLFQSTDGLIPLSKEIEHMECYLRIQKMRLDANFLYSIDVDPGIAPEKFKVVKLILQPLVENAIQHGISPRTKGEVIVSIYQQEGHLWYYIYDNGVGIEEEKIKSCLAADYTGDCIGLRNVNERLKLNFGEAYQLIFRKPEDSGTIIGVRQPIILEEEGKEENQNRNS